MEYRITGSHYQVELAAKLESADITLNKRGSPRHRPSRNFEFPLTPGQHVAREVNSSYRIPRLGQWYKKPSRTAPQLQHWIAMLSCQVQVHLEVSVVR